MLREWAEAPEEGFDGFETIFPAPEPCVEVTDISKAECCLASSLDLEV